MADWREYARIGQARLRLVPPLAWVVAGLLAVSLAAVFALEASGPSYVVLYDGLTPAEGGKVIAALQKLGIPYQLQAAGNVIEVPAPQLAEARLQLGAENIPQTGADAGWDKVEDAPMTASELAQDTMAAQALEASLAQSIETMNGIASAQVFLALPPDTPFLADQPKPAASVVISADDSDAQAQGSAIANLVAGAVPGLAAADVTVETTAGEQVYPAGDKAGTAAELGVVSQFENGAAARIAMLLTPLVGAGNFRTDVSADLDFTQEQIHQITYGPAQLVSHQVSAETEHRGNQDAVGGVPGALSNEPPAATSAASPGTGTPAGPGTGTPAADQTSTNLDQTYVTDQSDSEITKPDWAVKSVAVSVILNKAALGSVTPDQVKAAIAGAFAYPNVTVSVLAATFQPAQSGVLPVAVQQNGAAMTRAALELMAAAALLFGLALPLGRRLATLTWPADLPVRPARPLPASPAILAAPDFGHLRDRANENITNVARLLQSWVEDDA